GPAGRAQPVAGVGGLRGGGSAGAGVDVQGQGLTRDQEERPGGPASSRQPALESFHWGC
ncbi:unnamed protein product, partial [Heterosigma akashiwo]